MTPLLDACTTSGRLDLTYRATDDPNQRHRALRILRPTPDLAGAYRCKVASFEDEDTATDSMTVYGQSHCPKPTP